MDSRRISEDAEPKRLPVEHLRFGDILYHNVPSKFGKIDVRKAGDLIDDRAIADLKKNGVTEVYICVNKDNKKFRDYDDDVVPTIDRDTKKNAIEAINNRNIEELLKSSWEIYNKVMVAASVNKSDTYFYKYKISDYLEPDKSISTRALRIASFAVTVGRKYNQIIEEKNKKDGTNISEINLNILAQACLLREIGVNCSNPTVFAKLKQKRVVFPTSISQEVIDKALSTYDPKYKNLYAYMELYQQSNDASQLCGYIIGSSECPMGSGPLGLNLQYTSKYASTHILASNIIRACEVYEDSLTDIFANDVSLNNILVRLGQVFKSAEVDPLAYTVLMNALPIYSPGAKVLLTNGQHAIVKSNNNQINLKDRPVIEIIETGEIVDLSDPSLVNSRGLVIDKICDASVCFYDIASRFAKETVNNTSEFGTK